MTTLRPLLLALPLVAATVAWAAPLPVVRSPSVDAGRPAAGPFAGPAATDACGTSLGSAPQMLSRHAARGALAALPTTHSTDAGEIAVLEDDGSFFFPTQFGGGRREVDIASACRAFYRTHGDDYDQIAFYLSSGNDAWLGSPTALAAAFVIRNDTDGLGFDRFDLGAEFGSAARLQNVLVMNGLHRYVDRPDSATGVDQFTPLDLLAHEFAHRWAAYVRVDSAGTNVNALLGRANQHWSFLADVDASVLEGCSWGVVEPDSFVTDSVTTGFGGPDLYLMGLASKQETDSILVVYDGHDWNPPGTYANNSYPAAGVGARGRGVWYHVDDIERANGPRVPDATAAPHHFRLAFVLLLQNGEVASEADLAKLEAIRAAFVPYFVYATRGRGTLDPSLDSRAGTVSIGHQPLADTEDLLAPRPVRARIAIAQAGIPLAVDPSTVRLHWRNGPSGAWNELPMTPSAPDSFGADLPPAGAPGDVEYWVEAASDSPGIDARDPPAGPLAPHAYHAGPDLTPPVVLHTPPREQGSARMGQRLLARVHDNLAIDSVWAEVSIDGGPVVALAASPAGADSFAIQPGYGFAPGRWIAYRFLARDAAAAANLGVSNPSFDTLRVVRDWRLDFENGDDAVFHASAYGTYRDLWHLDRGWSSPAGGTAWRFGSADSTPYAPWSAGNLTLPLIPEIEPGTKLRFDTRWGFEERDSVYAWDGGRVEARLPGGSWAPLIPAAGYTHQYLHGTDPFERFTPCWSGTSVGWRAELFDLSGYAPGPLWIRFKALADDTFGDQGWWVDHIRLQYPSGVVTAVEPESPSLRVGLPWPNPATRSLAMSLAVPGRAEAEWALFDLQGRRVATLWRGAITPGANALRASLPEVAPGLYFSRVALDGRWIAAGRVAIVR